MCLRGPNYVHASRTLPERVATGIFDLAGIPVGDGPSTGSQPPLPEVLQQQSPEEEQQFTVPTVRSSGTYPEGATICPLAAAN